MRTGHTDPGSGSGKSADPHLNETTPFQRIINNPFILSFLTFLFFFLFFWVLEREALFSFPTCDFRQPSIAVALAAPPPAAVLRLPSGEKQTSIDRSGFPYSRSVNLLAKNLFENHESRFLDSIFFFSKLFLFCFVFWFLAVGSSLRTVFWFMREFLRV